MRTMRRKVILTKVSVSYISDNEYDELIKFGNF